MASHENEYALGAKEVQETILILNLSIAQIELSITEGDHSVNTLIDSFTFMSNHIHSIQESSRLISEMSGNVDGIQEHNDSLLLQTGELAEKMQQAIMAFQFYDKLSQRLDHVSKGLTGLAEIVSNEMHVKNAEQWESFKVQVRRGTTMREEEELFELIFDQQLPGDKAIEIMKVRMLERMQNQTAAEQDEEEIEFF
ncbi:hypothetical protein [Thiosulfativibrio zosterae]|uniref:Chemotaxis protein n=1 Tax=Thiosulfativibrio zosterae TaxID=2675053 RepID=A0A6F8PLU4_9GAMM|nr:hypothetical protein [Thiosulfativibrio zosterae]BBP43055.1 hypothetical protein THMIRHAT_08010 [Thiosulfativibrio zosterae]